LVQPGNKLTQNSKTANKAAAKEPKRGSLIKLGKLSFLLEDGALRYICWDDVEVIRGLSASVRDANWGSLMAENVREIREEEAGVFTFTRTYCHSNGALDLHLTICGNSSGHLRAEFLMEAKKDVSINRAGFNILHPISGVAGKPVEVRHSDGTNEELVFPKQIAPTQPVKDISRLSHRVGNIRISIEFDGETFEMEDQRNWSDASFKTYCRPLSLPFPFVVSKGEVIKQSVEIQIAEAKNTVKPAPVSPQILNNCKCRAPDVLLAIQPGWQLAGNLIPSGLLLRIGANCAYEDGALAALAKFAQQSKMYIDVEIITSSQRGQAAQITETANLLFDNDIAPKHVIALPETYLKSYQPGGPWPGGATPIQCAWAAASGFFES